MSVPTSCRVWLGITALLLAITAAHAQASKEAANPLEPLGWLVGKWTSEIKGADGNPLSVEVNYRWADNRRALRYDIQFKTGDQTIPQYEGTYWWHPAKKQIMMWQVDRNGTVTEAVVIADGTSIKQENTVYRSDGTQGEQRVEVVREGNDAFDFKALIAREGKFVPAVSFKYRRMQDAEPRK